MSDPILDLSQVSYSYGRQVALRDLTLAVSAGSTLGIIGPNGGGKTTLVKLMMNLLPPATGRILIDGLTPKQAVRRGDVIGYLPQKPTVPPNFPINVRQLAQLGLAGKVGLLRSASSEDHAFVDLLLERVGLKDLLQRPVGELSGGQLQRVLIARALAPRPKILVLDEPTTGIDRGGQQRFIESIAELQEALALTVVIISHDLRAMSAMCDRIACLDQTIHYHDVPHRMPAEELYDKFACDLQAAGISPATGDGETIGVVRMCEADCEHPVHQHHEPILPLAASGTGDRNLSRSSTREAAGG